MLLEAHKLFNTAWSAVEEAWEGTERLRRDAAHLIGMGDPLDKKIEFKAIGIEAANIQLSNVKVPRVIIELILKRLPLKDVLNSRLVSRAFSVIASGNALWNSFEIRNLFPNARFFLNEDDRPICSMEDYIVIKRMASMVEGKKNVAILSLSENECLNDYTEGENSVRIDPAIKTELGNKSQRSIVAISNGVIDGTKSLYADNREKIVKNLQCEPATALALTALGVRSSADQQIFDDNSASLCVDQKLVGDRAIQIRTIVGGNRTYGFYVNNFDLSVDNEHPFHGIACMRRLKSK